MEKNPIIIFAVFVAMLAALLYQGWCNSDRDLETYLAKETPTVFVTWAVDGAKE